MCRFDALQGCAAAGTICSGVERGSREERSAAAVSDEGDQELAMQGDQELAMQAARMCIWGGCRSG